MTGVGKLHDDIGLVKMDYLTGFRAASFGRCSRVASYLGRQGHYVLRCLVKERVRSLPRLSSRDELQV